MNTLNRVLVIVLSASAGALTAAPVRAADFTLTVPLDVKNLDEAVTRVGVGCELSATKDGARTVIGVGVTEITPDANTGNLPAQVEVSASVHSGYDPRDVDHYKCQIHLGTVVGPVAVNCARQAFTIPAPPGSDAEKDGARREVLVSDPTKPCRAIVEDDVPR